MELNFLDPTTGQLIAALDLGQGEITIGRGSQCQVVIPAHYSTVSSLHATIRPAGDSLEVIDGDGHRPSTNGVFINGVRQATGVWLPLSAGMTLSFGKPGLASSITLAFGMGSRSSASSRSVEKRVPSTPPPSAAIPNRVPIGQPIGDAVNTVSDSMKRRLANIDQHLSHGYMLKKELGAFPIIIGSDGRRHNISIFNNPAGFSWIAFFFQFAVCTQIREWSYFFVSSILLALVTIITLISGLNLSIASSMAICLMYGMYFPYLRHMALARNVREIPKGPSILLGVLLALLAAMPSFLIEIAAYYANN